MTDTAQPAARSSIREALARLAYERDTVRLAETDLSGWDWLVPSHRGIFAVAKSRFTPVIHGWFFGICRHGDHLYVFENCGHRDLGSNIGRVVKIDFIDKTLSRPHVIVSGLHNNCHQLAVIDSLLCVVDTNNQAIRRYTLDGDPVDVQYPVPVAEATDRTGAYVHVNSIAKVGNRVGLMLHNGKTLPVTNSEIIWLDANWHIAERYSLPGHQCHDIVADTDGHLWHSLSREGDVMRSDGVRLQITSDKMTRGIALGQTTMAIGTSTFGPRHLRGTLNGSLVTLDRHDFSRLDEVDLPAAPTDVLAI